MSLVHLLHAGRVASHFTPRDRQVQQPTYVLVRFTAVRARVLSMDATVRGMMTAKYRRHPAGMRKNGGPDVGNAKGGNYQGIARRQLTEKRRAQDVYGQESQTTAINEGSDDELLCRPLAT